MIKKIKMIAKNELFIGSLTLLILINLGNLVNYIFHFSMIRILGPADYGILAVLTNIIYIFGVPTASIQTVVSKYTTKFAIKKDFGKIRGLLIGLIKKVLLTALITFVIFLGVSVFLSKSLGIPFWLFVLTGSILFGTFICPVGIGILQGLKKFKIWGLNFILFTIIKFIIAIVLVGIGFKVYGAILGFIFGTFLSFLFIIPFIKEVTSAKKIKEKINLFSKESLCIFLAMFLIVLAYSLDVILAKGFFSEEIAGKYAVISLIGKMILFSTMAIAQAMFPISSEKFEKGTRTRGVIKKTFFSIFLICSFVIILLIIYPETIIKILFGSQYLSIAGILVYVGIAFSFISFLNTLILYRISTNKFKIKHLTFMFIFLVAQLVLLFMIHKTIEEFSLTFMFSTIIMFIGNLILIRK